MKQGYLLTGDRLRHDDRAVIIEFSGPRRVLSTSFFNGGFREDLRALFNFSEVFGTAGEQCTMRASTNEGHLRLIAEELGLDPLKSTGLSTAAKMKYAQAKSLSYDDFSVTAIVTAGIDVSGNRVGDPSNWHEKNGLPVEAGKPGTINIILLIDALLTPGAMARALATCTEAKTAALQELLAQSCFSRGLATGSGTDGTIVASRLDSAVLLTNAGTHSKLGEYIGRVVRETVIEALVAENGFESFARGNLLKRVSRFGINTESLWAAYRSLYRNNPPEKEFFLKKLETVNRNESLILQATTFAYLLDLLQWRMADPAGVVEAIDQLLGRSILAGDHLLVAATKDRAKITALIDELARAYTWDLAFRIAKW
jgi:adenosylcobinamide hydrolase